MQKNRKRRDPATTLVEQNLKALLEQRQANPATVRRHSSATNTAIYDFLEGRTASVRVDTLAKWADALDVPLMLLFVPPGRLREFQALLGSVGNLEPEELERITAIARTLATLNRGGRSPSAS